MHGLFISESLQLMFLRWDLLQVKASPVTLHAIIPALMRLKQEDCELRQLGLRSEFKTA